jgi:hypothetical protein
MSSYEFLVLSFEFRARDTEGEAVAVSQGKPISYTGGTPGVVLRK